MKTQRASQLFRFVTGKIRHHHCDLEHLLLKQRHTKRPLENRFQAIIKIRDGFLARAPRKIRMHHVALNRSRPNDRHFDHHVVKTFRFHSRQRRHLCAALDLKHADGVGVLHDLEGFLVVLWNVGEIERPPSFATQLERVLHHRHHAKA